jgi:hypothetical protein
MKARPQPGTEEVPHRYDDEDQADERDPVPGEVAVELRAACAQLAGALPSEARGPRGNVPRPVGQVIPVPEDVGQDVLGGQGGDGEVEAFEAEGREPEHGTDEGGQQRPGQHADGHGPPVAAGHVGRGVGAHPQEGTGGQAHQTRVAGQHHEPDDGDPEDEEADEGRHPEGVVLQHEGQGDGGDDDEPQPDPFRPRVAKGEVLPVRRVVDAGGAGHQTLSIRTSPKSP